MNYNLGELNMHVSQFATGVLPLLNQIFHIYLSKKKSNELGFIRFQSIHNYLFNNSAEGCLKIRFHFLFT